MVHSALLGGNRRSSCSAPLQSFVGEGYTYTSDEDDEDHKEGRSSSAYDLSHLLVSSSSSKQGSTATATMAPAPETGGGMGEKTAAPSFNHQQQGQSFGEGIDNYCTNPVDTSFLSLESKDTAVSSVTAEETTVTSSDCGGTESGSVAMLRGWLDEFGKQHKDHFVQNARVGATPSNILLEKPTRPKVAGQAKKPQAVVQPPPRTGGSVQQQVKQLAVVPHAATPAKQPIAKHLAMVPNSAASTARRHYGTPVRIKPQYETSEVQATNEGYASVAKLSKWLADDPTAKKKVKQIRRGANILAKSRKFDKGLEGVIVEESYIRTGHVMDKKHLIQQSLSRASSYSTDEPDPFDDGASFCSFEDRTMWKRDTALFSKANSTIGLGFQQSDAATSVSVNDKRQWLSNAFKRGGTGSDGADAKSASNDSIARITRKPEPRAKTDFVTREDLRDDATALAKQMWRQRSPPRPKANSPLKSRSSATNQRVVSPRRDDSVKREQFVASNVESSFTPRSSEASATVSEAVSSLTQDAPPVDDTVPAAKPGPKEQVQNTFERTDSGSVASLMVDKTAVEQPRPAEELVQKNCRRASSTPIRGSSGDQRRQSVEASPARKFFQNLETKAATPEKSSAGIEQEDEEEKHVDFRKAREMLVARSKKNGNSVEVLSKVNRRKAMFEQMEKDNRRKSVATGKLKTTWVKPQVSFDSQGRGGGDGGSISSGASNQYQKEYVEDIVPKKSFEELP